MKLTVPVKIKVPKILWTVIEEDTSSIDKIPEDTYEFINLIQFTFTA